MGFTKFNNITIEFIETYILKLEKYSLILKNQNTQKEKINFLTNISVFENINNASLHC